MGYGELLIACPVTFIPFGIWCGVFFGIFWYYFEDYSEAQCIVNSYTEWQIFDNEYRRAHYRKLLVSVEIEGEFYPGFACEADGSHYTEWMPDALDTFPYQFSACSDWITNSYTSCSGGEEFLPRWLCTSYHSETKFTPGTKHTCYYTIRNGDGLNKLQNERIHKHSKYIEASFKEGPYYPETSYYVWMSLGLGATSVCVLFFSLVFIACILS